jgi:hypothetical protein
MNEVHMKTSKTPATPPQTAAAQVHELSSLPFLEIKALWRKLFGGEPPTHNRQFLERQLAYKLQEVEFRKVDPALLDRNNKKIASLIATGKLRKRDRDFHPTPGTKFTREYHGKFHEVIAMADGQYNYNGQPYRSLSMVARLITSSRWSGPVFFGLKDYAAKSPAKKGGAK